MNLSVEYQAPRASAPERIEEKSIYVLGVAFLLALWAAFTAMTVLVVVAVFVPGHVGLSDWLRLLGDSPMFTT
jgi:hypothetical protein